MKKSDIAMIILIASVSILIAYFVMSSIPAIGKVGKQTVEVKTAEPITAELTPPDPTVFNSNAINPTIEVTIGGGSSSTPALQGTQ